jgi:hypothetical protein
MNFEAFLDRKTAVLERREHVRCRVLALVEFEWTDKGMIYRGHDLTRDISMKGMFIYSNLEPPEKADLQVDAFSSAFTEPLANLYLSTRSSVVHVESPTSREALFGFAILNRGFELDNRQ